MEGESHEEQPIYIRHIRAVAGCISVLANVVCHEGRKKDEALRRCAIAFLKQFVPPIKTLKDGEIYVSNIERQHGKIDVLLTVEGGYKVIVEDKTFTSDHDEQLTRYKDLLISEGVGPELIYGVYYKTGFESDTSNAEKAGYAVFDRKRILSILNANSSGATNDIF